MSFLSYLSHPVLAVASVGGVSLGVALLLFPPKTATLGNLASRPFLSSSQIKNLSSKATTSIEEENDCKVISGPEIYKVVYSIPNYWDYIAITCKNEGKGSDDFLEGNFVALFPLDLFKEEKIEELKTNQNKKLFIKTVTEMEGKNDERGAQIKFKTKFSSDEFSKKEVVGNWKYDDWRITSDRKADIVNLKDTISSGKIYFVH